MTTHNLNLSRAQLSTFLNDHKSIMQFESLFKEVDAVIPASLADINLAIVAATALAQQATDDLVLVNATLATLGTISTQDANNVAITGGSISGATITGGTVTSNLTNNQTILLESSATLTNGAGAALGTLTNAPVAGNPTKWVSINDNGTTLLVPGW